MLRKQAVKGDRLMKSKNMTSFFIGLLGMQLVLWLLSLGAVSLLFLGVEGMVELSAILSLVLCCFWGYRLSKRTQTANLKPVIILFSIWVVIPAVLIYFTQHSNIGWSLSFPYSAIAQTLFPSYFNTPQSAFVLNVLQPLLVACSYILTLFSFGVGLYVNRRSKSK